MFLSRLVSSTFVVTLAGAALPAWAAQDAPAGVAAKAGPHAADLARWQKTAGRVTIMRDKWGIPHVFGKLDADAVFGMVYAQAEDDFNRVELNYINAMGRLAEVEGEKEVWRDLRMKLYIRPDDLQAKYAASPAWLKDLMTAWADGLNFYLHTHPEVKPKLLRRFEPWMALSFSEGSIGGDIEEIDLKELEAFYGKALQPTVADKRNARDAEPRGSNGFAIAPKLSASGHPLLLINPHTSFYFRPEIHMVSDQGLNAYGAVTRLAESRDYETNSRQNGWWLAQLTERYRIGEDPAGLMRFPETLKLLTTKAVRAAARTYFNTKRYVQVTLYPEKK